MSTGLANTGLAAMVTAVNDAATVLRQAIRTTGSLLNVSCAGVLAGGFPSLAT
jgi:hypothetical protein